MRVKFGRACHDGRQSALCRLQFVVVAVVGGKCEDKRDRHAKGQQYCAGASRVHLRNSGVMRSRGGIRYARFMFEGAFHSVPLLLGVAHMKTLASFRVGENRIVVAWA
jgi:hypothetical protein